MACRHGIAAAPEESFRCIVRNLEESCCCVEAGVDTEARDFTCWPGDEALGLENLCLCCKAEGAADGAAGTLVIVEAEVEGVSFGQGCFEKFCELR